MHISYGAKATTTKVVLTMRPNPPARGQDSWAPEAIQLLKEEKMMIISSRIEGDGVRGLLRVQGHTCPRSKDTWRHSESFRIL